MSKMKHKTEPTEVPMPSTAEPTAPVAAAEPVELSREKTRCRVWADVFAAKTAQKEHPGACKDAADYAVRCFDEACPAKAVKGT